MAWKEPPLKRSYACNSDLLVFLRERKGLTQNELSQAAGYSERLISKAEAGQPISTATVADLAEALSSENEPVYPEDLITDPVSLAKEYMAALHTKGNGIVEAIQRFLDDEMILRITGDPKHFPFAGEHCGIEAVRRAFDLFFSILEAPANHDHAADYRYVGQGNEVILWGKSWIHPIGQPMERPIPIAHRFVFERGKLVLLEDVYDTLAGSESLHG